MGSIFMGISNIFIVKTSPSPSSSARSESKESYIDLWERVGEDNRGANRIGEERRGQDRRGEERRERSDR